MSNRARDPVKGLRVKLRNELRKHGVTGKFKVDLHRRYAGITQQTLVVIGLESGPINFFEGYPVKYLTKS